MKFSSVGTLCVAMLLLTPTLSALTFETDFKDSDFIFGRNRGDLTTRYVLVRNNFFLAINYVRTLLTVTTSNMLPADVLIDYHVSPRSGRTIQARSLQSSASTYINLDAYTNPSEDSRISWIMPLQNNSKGRTNACMLSVNLNAVNHTVYTINYTLFTTFVHDLYDCLVFNKPAFSRFINNTDSGIAVATPLAKDKFITNSDFDGAKRDFWTLDNGVLPSSNTSIITYLKGAYRSDVTGVLMENDGDDAGIRFENSIYYADVSASLNTQPKLLTRMAPWLAVATGFYSFTPTIPASFQFNYFPSTKTIITQKLADIDVNFQTKQCLTSSALGSCTTEGELSCSPDGLYKMKCVTDPVGGSCKIRVATDFCTLARTSDVQGHEFYGANARCIMTITGGVSTPSCMKVNSVATATAIVIEEKNQTVTCDGVDNKKTLPVTTATQVVCPGETAFLTAYNFRCGKDCNGNGICLWDGSASMGGASPACLCFTGWAPNTGSDQCSVFTDYVANPNFIDPYNSTGLGWVRLDFGNIQAVAVFWSLFTAFWYFN